MVLFLSRLGRKTFEGLTRDRFLDASSETSIQTRKEKEPSPASLTFFAFMFSQEHRLRYKKDFESVFKGGKSVFDPACGIKFRKNDLDHSRFAIVVGTKVHKSAVKRNRIRRQYREIIKRHLEEIEPGFDVILFTAKPVLELDFGQKEACLLRVLKKAELIL